MYLESYSTQFYGKIFKYEFKTWRIKSDCQYIDVALYKIYIKDIIQRDISWQLYHIGYLFI